MQGEHVQSRTEQWWGSLGLQWQDQYSEKYKTRLFQVDELINTLSIRIYDMAAFRLKAPEWSGQTTLDSFCRIFYVENGTARVVCNGEDIALEPKKFYLFPAWTKMHFPENHDTLLYLIHCRLSTLAGIDLWHMFAPHAVVLDNSPEELREEFKRFAMAPPADMAGQLDVLALVYKLVALFFRDGGFTLQRGTDKVVGRITRAIDTLEKNPTIVYRAEKLAKMCGLSRSRFSTDFKKLTGMSPARYQMVHRLWQIQQQLLHTDVTLEALAYDYGFSSAYHLSNTFKRHLGISPSLFRKSGSRLQVAAKTTK